MPQDMTFEEATEAQENFDCEYSNREAGDEYEQGEDGICHQEFKRIRLSTKTSPEAPPV